VFTTIVNNSFNKNVSQTNISGAKISLQQITDIFTTIITGESNKKVGGLQKE
jgi:hypothetical protein